ncbi:MAG: hypothetical protein CTY35_01110 [Methylotenera sp.]|jgi:hypothetical protein|nr:MAG: hypothetical protein CTY35_01110 [Methylotenera sp.]
MANIASDTKVKKTNKFLMLVLFITLATTVWTALQEDEPVDDITVSKPSRPHREVSVSNESKANRHHKSADSAVSVSSSNEMLIPWHKLKREPLTARPYDLFKVHSWVEIPVVKKVKPQPPPPPVAPPAPFTYVGKLEDSPKGTQVFLMSNGKLYAVVQGEKINQQWRFESEDANALRLNYLPLNLVQILSKSAKPLASAEKPLAIAELIQ